MVERFERFSLAIFEISRCWHKIASEEMAPYGLRGSHALYLTVLSHYPKGVTAPELAEQCGRDKSDVSRSIAALEAGGFAEKEGGYGGMVKLTAEGRSVARKIRKRAALAVELAGGQLGERTRSSFYRALEQIAAQLKEISEEGLPRS